MKKKSLQNKLQLNKNVVSKFKSAKLTGGTRTSNLCSVVCSGQCGTIDCGPAPTKDGGSWCICL